MNVLVISLRSRTLKSSSAPLRILRRSRSSALEIVLHFLGRNAVARRHHDRVDVGVAGDAPLQRAQRHDDQVVLVLAETRLTLRRQQADDLARQLAEPDLRRRSDPGRRTTPSSPCRRARRPRRRARSSLSEKLRPDAERPVAHLEILVGRAGDLRRPVANCRRSPEPTNWTSGATARTPEISSSIASHVVHA